MNLLAETLTPLPLREFLGWGSIAAIGAVAAYLLRRTKWESLRFMGTVIWFGTGLLAAGLGINELLGRSNLIVASGSCAISPVWPLGFIWGVGVGLWTLIALFYVPRVIHLPSLPRRVLIGLRFATATLLLLTMLRPTAQWSRHDKEPSELLIAVDISRSMSTTDMSGGLSRFATQSKLLIDAHPLLEKIREQGVVRFLEYGSNLNSVETLSLEPTSPLTAIGDALQEIGRMIQGRKVTGIVLMGDGAQRSLPPRQEDPRQAARVIGELQIPIHTVTFGASQLEGTTVDLILENLRTSPTVFVKNRALLQSNLRALGAAGRELTVQLLVEKTSPDNPNIKTPEALGEPLILKPSSGDQVLPVEMGFIPEIPGEYKIGLKVQPVDGEVLLTNNEQWTYLTVLKGGISIAYFDSPRFEQRFLRQIDESPDIQVDFTAVRSGPRIKNEPPKAEMFRPGAYDIYIIGDVPAEYFGSTRNRTNPLLELRNMVDSGVGLLMLGGANSFSRGDYGRTPLAEILPIVLSGTKDQAPDDYTEDLKLVPTPAGLDHFIMRLDATDKNSAAWEALLPLKGASRFGDLQPLGQSLATTPQGAPLLASQVSGRGRVLAFAGDTTWRWVTSGHEVEHQQFWRQAILWLAHKEDQGDENIWVKLDTRRLRQGQPLAFTCGARDKRGEPIADAQFQVEVLDPNNARFQPTVQSGSRDSVGSFVETLIPGDYSIRVTGTVQGKPLGLGAQARFLVYAEDLELTNPIADAGLMNDIAELTGGQNLRPEQFPEFLKNLASHGLSPEVEQTTSVSLWDNAFVVLLMTLMLCSEWFYRKLKGLV